VTKLLGDPAGTVRGKPALRSYFAKGLAAAPDLKFELLDVFAGVSSVAAYSRSSVRGLQLEVMELDADGRIARVLVHHRALRGARQGGAGAGSELDVVYVQLFALGRKAWLLRRPAGREARDTCPDPTTGAEKQVATGRDSAGRE